MTRPLQHEVSYPSKREVLALRRAKRHTQMVRTVAAESGKLAVMLEHILLAIECHQEALDWLSYVRPSSQKDNDGMTDTEGGD